MAQILREYMKRLPKPQELQAIVPSPQFVKLLIAAMQLPHPARCPGGEGTRNRSP